MRGDAWPLEKMRWSLLSRSGCCPVVTQVAGDQHGDQVGGRHARGRDGPEPAAVLARMPSTRNCWPRSRRKATSSVVNRSPTLPVNAISDRLPACHSWSRPTIMARGAPAAQYGRAGCGRSRPEVHSVPAPRSEPRAYSSARIERLTTDQKVGGSNPPGRATLPSEPSGALVGSPEPRAAPRSAAGLQLDPGGGSWTLQTHGA